MLPVCATTLAMEWGGVRGGGGVAVGDVGGSKNNAVQLILCFHFHKDSRHLSLVSRLAWGAPPPSAPSQRLPLDSEKAYL